MRRVSVRGCAAIAPRAPTWSPPIRINPPPRSSGYLVTCGTISPARGRIQNLDRLVGPQRSQFGADRGRAEHFGKTRAVARRRQAGHTLYLTISPAVRSAPSWVERNELQSHNFLQPVRISVRLSEQLAAMQKTTGPAREWAPMRWRCATRSRAACISPCLPISTPPTASMLSFSAGAARPIRWRRALRSSSIVRSTASARSACRTIALRSNSPMRSRCRAAPTARSTLGAHADDHLDDRKLGSRAPRTMAVAAATLALRAPRNQTRCTKRQRGEIEIPPRQVRMNSRCAISRSAARSRRDSSASPRDRAVSPRWRR